jgi:hypothetical protein
MKVHMHVYDNMTGCVYVLYEPPLELPLTWGYGESIIMRFFNF